MSAKSGGRAVHTTGVTTMTERDPMQRAREIFGECMLPEGWPDDASPEKVDGEDVAFYRGLYRVRLECWALHWAGA